VKKLLIVSREFLPSRVVSSQRIGAFSKFLPEYGFTVHVITQCEDQLARSGEELRLRQVLPECASEESTIACVPGAQRSARLVLRAQDRLNAICRMGGIVGSLAAFVRKPFSAYAFYTFGEHNAWVRNAVQQAIESADRTSPDGVFATFGGEYWNLGAASQIAKRLRIPLVLDFRDGWDWFFGFSGRRSLIYPMMRRFVRRSTLITAATRSVQDRLTQFWPNAPVELVYNGFDISTSAFALGSRSPATDEIKIGHLGTFWPNPRWCDFCQALEHVARTTPIRLIYRGRNPDQFRHALPWGTSPPPGMTLDIAGLCDRSEIVALYGELDMAVAAARETDRPMGSIPAKLIEAIGFSKPFIMLADRSPAYLVHFLRGCSSPHLVVDNGISVAQIETYMLDLRRGPRSVPRMPAAYSAQRRAGELAGKLLDVL